MSLQSSLIFQQSMLPICSRVFRETVAEKSILARQVSDGYFPNGHLPEDIPLMDSSHTGSSLNDISPNRHFPDEHFPESYISFQENKGE